MKLNVSRFFNANFIWRMVALLLGCILFTSHFASGLFAKYSSGVSGSDQARVANFSYSAKVSDVSALSFTNTAFWGGTKDEDKKIAMNVLRSVDFNVNNFKMVNGEQVVSEVDMRYDLVFVAPRNFARKIAFQLFDGLDQPLLPQIVMLDVLNTPDDGELNTMASKDYNATIAVGIDKIFKVQRTLVPDMSDAYDKTLDAYTLTYTDATYGQVTINIEPIKKQLTQTLQFRLWDTSQRTATGESRVDTEGGKLCSPLSVTYQSEAICYRIAISFEKMFLFEAAEPQTHKYTIRLAPTEQLDDTYLGGSFYVGENPTDTLYAGQELTLRTNHETITDTVGGNVIKTYSQVVNSAFKEYTTDMEPVVNETMVLEKEHTVELPNRVADVTAEGNVNSNNNNQYIYFTEQFTTPTNQNNAKYRIQYKKSGDSEGSFKYTIKPDWKQNGEILHKTVTTQEITAVDNSKADKVVLTVKETENASHLIPYLNTMKFSFTNVTGLNIILSVKNNNTWDTLFEPNQNNTSYEIETGGGDTHTEPYGETKTTYITRTIVRTSIIENIELLEVKRKLDSTDEDFTYYTSETDSFNLIGNDDKQKFYVSQSYSKNYPLSVNVLFEQIQ